MHDWRAVAALYAGLFFNLTFLQEAGVDHGMAEAPFSLAIWLFLGGLFLARAVFWAPATSGLNFTDFVMERLGRPAALFIKWLLLPVWLATWFGANISLARDAVTGWPMFIAWVVIAGLGVLQPERGAFFAIKVSVALILGLLLSVRHYLSFNYLDMIAWSGPPRSLSLHLLPWALPPLLLTGAFRTKHPKRVALYGIILPLLIATFAAIYTMNGAGEVSVYFLKVSSYGGYAAARYSQTGWIKLMSLSFTLILAARFAGHFTLRLTDLERNTTNAILVTTALTATSQLIPAWWGEQPLWLLASVPFAPLAGVLAARRAPPVWALAAWLAGCAAAYATESNIFTGWLVGFVICSAARLLARLSYGQPNP